MNKRKAVSGVQEHINEKFEKYAKKRGILLLGIPGFCEVSLFNSVSGRSQVHTAVPAKKGTKKGYIVNVADKKLKFFPETAAHCSPVKK